VPQAQGQTREHALLAYYFGVRSLVVAVNKMDVVDWSQQRFMEVKDRLTKVLKGVGYDVEKVGHAMGCICYGLRAAACLLACTTCLSRLPASPCSYACHGIGVCWVLEVQCDVQLQHGLAQGVASSLQDACSCMLCAAPWLQH
jgi:hypothetical protein